MKCEHEGCDERAEGRAEVVISFPYDKSQMLCKHHLAAWLREKADEVEGVKECDECGGFGRHPYVMNAGSGGDEIDWYECEECHGTGRVPR